MNNYRQSNLGLFVALLTAVLVTPSTATAVEPVPVLDDGGILLDIPAIISSIPKGIPEGSGRGIQKASGPFYSSNGRLGGVIFHPSGVRLTLKGGKTRAILFHVDGDTPFQLPLSEYARVPVLSGKVGPKRILQAPGEKIRFTGSGSRPLNGLTVPYGVSCSETAVINLDLTPKPQPAHTPITDWHARAVKLTDVKCDYSDGRLYDKIEGIQTESIVEEFITATF